jgi:hypothetical protein
MDTFQLEVAISRDPVSAKRFGGVKAADRLPLLHSNSNKFYIVNSQNSNLPGEHWVVIGLGMVPEFFDSLGQTPESYQKSFQYFLVNYGPNYRFNQQRLQNRDSDVCGKYCLLYIYHKSRNVSLKCILKLFSSDLESNDRLVSAFCRKIYGI